MEDLEAQIQQCENKMENWPPVQKTSLPVGINRFKRVLNQECPTIVAEIGEGVDTLSIDTEVPTVEEVK